MVGYVHTQRCGGSAGLALGYHIFVAMRLMSRPCRSPRPALRTPHFRQIVQNKQIYVRYVRSCSVVYEAAEPRADNSPGWLNPGYSTPPPLLAPEERPNTTSAYLPARFRDTQPPPVRSAQIHDIFL
jgi:hypothetical protein